MTTNTSLYGLPRPKSTRNPPPTSASNLTFTSTLTSLLALTPSSTNAPTTTTGGRPRPSKIPRDSIFTSHNANTKKRALADISTSANDNLALAQSHSQTTEAIDAATLHRSKRKMEEKARLYASMKRGDYVPPTDGRGINKEENAMVDFDRKWAEEAEAGQEPNYETSSDDGAASGDSEEAEALVEYEDEFGRLRRGTRAEAARELRQRKAQAYAKEELAAYAARPDRPANLIYGDTVQAAAFNPDASAATRMEALARKRDRSMTPPDEVHYDGSKEVRSKGVGFYQFSLDGAGRKREMEALGREREETERVRREREERKEKKRVEVEERKKAIAKKRGERLAEKFLDSLEGI